MPRVFSGRVIFYLILLLALDLSVTPFFQIGPMRPVLQYLIILYAAFHWGWQPTVAMAFMVGLSRDMTGSSTIGSETLSLVAMSFPLDLLVQKMERERTLLRFLAAFFYVFCISISGAVVLTFFTGSPAISWYGIFVALGTAFYTACLTPLFFKLSTQYFHGRISLKQYELFK